MPFFVRIPGEVGGQSGGNGREIAMVEFFEGSTHPVVEEAAFTRAEGVINVIPIKDMGKIVLGQGTAANYDFFGCLHQPVLFIQIF
jgi:hypothetical protein